MEDGDLFVQGWLVSTSYEGQSRARLVFHILHAGAEYFQVKDLPGFAYKY